MLNLGHNTRVFLHVPPTDLRKSFDGLGGLVRSAFGADVADGSWFLFLNKRRDRIKILYWDRDGEALWYKRLSQGTFESITAGDGATTMQCSGKVRLRKPSACGDPVPRTNSRTDHVE